MLAYFLILDKKTNLIKKFIYLFTSFFILIVSTSFFEGILIYFLNIQYEPSISVNVFITALRHFIELINSLLEKPLQIFVGCVHSIFSQISYSLIIFSACAFIFKDKNNSNLSHDEELNYRKMLLLLFVLSLAGMLSGSISGQGFGVRLMEGIFVLTPFAIIGIRKILIKFNKIYI